MSNSGFVVVREHKTSEGWVGAPMRVGGVYHGTSLIHRFTTYESASISMRTFRNTPSFRYCVAPADSIRAKPEDFHK